MTMTEMEPEPLQVLVVGAGICGLAVALGLRQSGHHVTLFERSGDHSEVGAALNIMPNAHGLLRKLGVYPETFGANPMNRMSEYDGKGNLKFTNDLRNPLKIWQHPWMLSHRVGLHEALKNHATDPQGKGPPAVLKKSQKVIGADAETATITLQDGSTVTGDLIIGADGISSIIRKEVVGDSFKPFGSGKSAFRFMIPCADILNNEQTRDLVHDGHMALWVANDRRLVMYTCSDNKIMNCVAIHPSNITDFKGDASEWDHAASKDALLDVFKDFGPQVQSLLSLADKSTLRIWTLLDMDRIPRWTKGRLVLMGDAAHPFLPYQGQGAGVAIEDAASLTAVLPLGISRDEIPERLTLYEKIRDERAHKIQEFTRRVGMDLDDKSKGDFNIMEFINYNFSHDEFDNSHHAVREFVLQKNGPVHRQLPTAFGPLPGPRQDHLGRKLGSRDSKFTTYYIRFKTSATFLKTFFPHPSFSFQSPGTMAEATWKCTKQENMAWLGGGSHCCVGLLINGVQYAKKDGSKIFGSYLPLQFDDSCDSVLSGREELGMPKLFSDISIQKQNPAEATVTCSRGGVEFVKLELSSLQEEVSDEKAPKTVPEPKEGAQKPPGPPVPKEDGQFAYKYVPKVGSGPGVADMEYTLFLSNEAAAASRTVERAWQGVGGKSSICVREETAHSLPTLYHVTSSLATIPVYEIMEVRVEEGQGLEDFDGAQRVE